MPRLEGERRGGTGVDGGLTGRDVWLTDGDDDAPALGADDAEPLVVPDAAPEDPEEAALDAAEELDELVVNDESAATTRSRTGDRLRSTPMLRPSLRSRRFVVRVDVEESNTARCFASSYTAFNRR